MTKTRDYMDYLDEKIGIAPANSQEEYQASKVIADLMGEHDIETSVQEFESQGSGLLVYNILALIMFVALVVEGLVPDMLHVVLLLVSVACAGILTFTYFVRNPFEGLGPSRKSQNVIGVRRAQSPNATRGSRPIVIVAHYDTPRENKFYQGGLARYHSVIMRISAVCPVVVTATLVFQLLLFLPAPLHMFMWIAGLLAALPVLLVTVMSFMGRAANCTIGANCNKSSVAALFSMIDKVSPSDDAATGMAQERRTRRQAVRAGDQEKDLAPHPASRRVEVMEPVVGVRHGEEVLRSLNILPPSCEITYEEPRVQLVEEDDARDYSEAIDEDFDEDRVDEYEEFAASDEGDAASYTEDWVEEDWPADEEEGSESEETDEPQDEGSSREDEEDERNEKQGPVSRRKSLPPIGLEEGDDEDDSEADYYDDEYDEDTDDYEDLDEYDDEFDDDERVGSSIGSWFSTRISALRDRFAPGKEDEEWIDEEDLEDEVGDQEPAEAEQDMKYSDEDDEDFDEEEYDEDDYDDTDEEDFYDYDDDFEEEQFEDEDAEYEDYWDDEESEEFVEDDETDNDGEYEDAESFEEGEETDHDALADMAFDAEQDEAYEADFEYEDYEDPEDDYAYRSRLEARSIHETAAEETEDTAFAEDESDDEPYEDDAVADEQDDEYYEDMTYEDEYEYEDEYAEEEVEEGTQRPQSIAERILSFFHRGPRQPQDATRTDYEEEYYLDDESELEGEYQEWDEDYNDESEYEDEAYEAYDDDYVSEYDGKPSELPSEPLPDPNMLHFDREEDDDILPRDDSGITTISDSYDLYAGEVRREVQHDRPAAVEDPTWGTSEYQPTRPSHNLARRAALYDVPDPSGRTIDPLEDDYEYEEEVVTTRQDASRGNTGPRSGFWHDDTGDRGQSSDWKGGATLRDDLRDDMPFDEGAMQDAMLELGDEFLDEHDIWFVATGASEDSHAGMKAFIDEHKREIRGAFLVNLECVGAGTLAAYAREGLYDRRRADRRLVRMVCDIARDLHIGFDTAMCDWGETDAAAALRSRVRAVTIVGLDENDQPALSHTVDDVPENVNPRQVDDVVRIVTEVIRRA